MRRLLLTLIAGVVLAALPHAATAHHERSVYGRIATVSPSPATWAAVDAARCAWLEHGEASQGVLGHMIGLGGEEADGRHFFELVARWEPTMERTHSAAVVFYEDLGTCGGGDWVTGVYGTGVAMIPETTRYALVVPYAVVTPPGAGVCYGGVCHQYPHVEPPHAQVFRFTVDGRWGDFET